jgi:hypothetical protein
MGIATLALLVLSLPALGQWTAGAHLGLLVDDNSFNNYLQVSDRVTELSLQTGYDWENENSRMGLSYSGLANAYSVIPSRTYYEHGLELAYGRIFGEDEATLLNAGLKFSLRDNRDEYTVYDHSQWSLDVNLRHYLSETSSFRFGYMLRKMGFAELPDFDYWEHATFLQAGWTSPARTSVFLQADLDYKSYVTANIDSAAGQSSGSGHGRGRETASTPKVMQLIGTLKLGQGIAEKTGLSLTGQYQLSLQKESRYLSFSGGILTDDELFDDHFGYEGPLVSLMLTQLFSSDFRVRLSGTLQRRQYSDRPALDLIGTVVDAQRVDNRSVFSASVEKSFEALGVRMTIVYDRIINSSNDAYYDYRNNALSMRLSYAY